MGRSTQVQEWSGLPVREVQLGDEVDVNNPDAVAKAAERVLIDKERLARGELKKVKKISPGTNIEGQWTKRGCGMLSMGIFASCVCDALWMRHS